jgi:transposase
VHTSNSLRGTRTVAPNPSIERTQAAADNSKPTRGKDALSSAEHEALARLRRENKRLQQMRDILAKAAAWFAVKSDKTSIASSNS